MTGGTRTVEVNRKYIEHVGNNFSRSYIRSIIERGQSLDGDVENFYGVEGAPGTVGSIYKSNERMGVEGEERVGKTPDELVKLLMPFDNEGIDVSKLEYGAVRSDYQEWNKGKGWKFSCVLFSGPSFLGGVVGTVAYIVSKFSKDISVSEWVLPASIAATLIGATSIYGILRKPKRTNNEIDEFRKLKHAGKDATRFIREGYRDYLIQKALEK